MAIAEMTDSPVFRAKFINAVVDVPISMLLRPGPLGLFVCEKPPTVRLIGLSASFSFIVDLSTFNLAEILDDGLGWNLPLIFTFIFHHFDYKLKGD
ncbi:unnamed protein product [Gongylonema pulchrum]|uniref:Uncharacterized protein n=1 Tax=Gongylonema pulchrum TaxID=637853 RepID=A0A183D0J9_9BILA|nr:unnamed protein product [Gongylonema pulchrum]